MSLPTLTTSASSSIARLRDLVAAPLACPAGFDGSTAGGLAYLDRRVSPERVWIMLPRVDTVIAPPHAHSSRHQPRQGAPISPPSAALGYALPGRLHSALTYSRATALSPLPPPRAAPRVRDTPHAHAVPPPPSPLLLPPAALPPSLPSLPRACAPTPAATGSGAPALPPPWFERRAARHAPRDCFNTRVRARASHSAHVRVGV